MQALATSASSVAAATPDGDAQRRPAVPAAAPTEVEVAIVGAGHAGVECAWELRSAGLAGAILLLGDEPHLPYERPPLSKGLLAGATDAQRMALRAQAAYDKAAVFCELDDPVVRLDVATRQLQRRSGAVVRYRDCVLATGARARRLPELSGAGVHVVRRLDDSMALRGALAPGRQLLVVGGGYLGLEAACTARRLGADATVIEQGPALMGGKVSAATAERLAALHREAGVTLHLGTRIATWRRVGARWQAELADGRLIEADEVLVSVGAEAEDTLAREAGLACDGGIVIGPDCRSSDPHVFAIGDCASAHRPQLGRHARVESVQNAQSQARIAAAAITGQAPPAQRAPTFWSEQQGRRLQMAGLVHPDLPCIDLVTETAKGWLVERQQDGRLVALEAVDSPADFVRGIARLNAAAA